MTKESRTDDVYRRIRELFPVAAGCEFADVGGAIVRALESRAEAERRPLCPVCKIFHAPGEHDLPCGNCGCAHDYHDGDGPCSNGAHGWTCSCVAYVAMTRETARERYVAEAASEAGQAFDIVMKGRVGSPPERIR